MPLGVMVIVLSSADQEVVQVNVGENEIELLTDVLFMDTLKVMVITVLSGSSWPMGDFETTIGIMNVLKLQG